MNQPAEASCDPFLSEIVEVAATALGVDPAMIAPLARPNSDAQKGDYSIPLFPLAKSARRNPAEIATKAAAAVPAGAASGLIARAEAAGGYLNFFVDRGVAARRIVGLIASEGKRYGSSTIGDKRTVVIDYSSPNVAKHLAFHHIRSTMIGNSLARLLRFQSFTVKGLNFLGDWGMSFAKLIVAMRRYQIAKSDLEDDPVTKLQDLYIRFNQDAAADPSLESEARDAFTKLEAGDQSMLATWEFIRKASLDEFMKLYARLGVSFEEFKGEAAYDQASQDAVIERLEMAGLTSTDADGRLVVDLKSQGIEVPCILRKSDGASLYATRDLAAIFDRHQRYRFDRALYVVDMGQSLHFKQWFAVVKLLGEPWADEILHLPFGIVVNVDGGRLRTRKGGAVLLEDVLDQAIEQTRKIIESSPHTELTSRAEIDQVAEWLGIGAVVFNDLKSARVKDVKFDIEEIVKIDGFTAPYIQYAHARIHGIFRKAGVSKAPTDADTGLLVHEREHALVRNLAGFRDVIARAAREYEPSLLASYLFDLATELSRFYHECRVISDDRPLMDARLALLGAVATVLATGLELLGIRAPTRI